MNFPVLIQMSRSSVWPTLPSSLNTFMHLEQPWMDNTSPFPDPDFPSQGTPLVVVLLLQSCVKFTTSFFILNMICFTILLIQAILSTLVDQITFLKLTSWWTEGKWANIDANMRCMGRLYLWPLFLSDKNINTQIDKYTNTQTHIHTKTQIQKHTNTYMPICDAWARCTFDHCSLSGTRQKSGDYPFHVLCFNVWSSLRCIVKSVICNVGQLKICCKI